MESILQLKEVQWTTGKLMQYDNVKSSLFTFQGCECWFKLRYRWDGTSDFRLYIESEKRLSVPFDATVQIKNRKSSHPARKVTVVDNTYPMWGCTKSKMSNLSPNFDSQSYLRFKVVFYNEYIAPTSRVQDETPSHFETDPCLKSLSHDLSELLQGGGGPSPDMRLRSGDKTTVQAHRKIMAARSEVFAAMLRSDMVEGQTGLVEVEDMEGDILQQFVQYLYTGTMAEPNVDTAMKLYQAGEKYAVGRLRERCADFLSGNLTQESACECLALADAHGDQKLKDSVTSYILEKNIPLSGDNWSAFCNEHPKLANEVLNHGFKLLSLR